MTLFHERNHSCQERFDLPKDGRSYISAPSSVDIKLAGIYKITNIVSGHFYIGSAVSMARRFRVHVCSLKKGAKTNRHLQNAWHKYGPDSFVFSPILFCKQEDLLFYEQICIDGLRPEYNIRKDAHSNLGIKMSDVTRAKISAVQKGIRRGAPSEEHRRNLSIALTGKKRTDAMRKRSSESQKGKVLSMPARQNMSKLSLDQVTEIRTRIARGDVQRAIAKDYLVAASVITNIKTGKTYAWATEL